MNVSVCEKIGQSADTGKAIKAETSDDSFQVLLQMLLQGILNTGNMPLQNANITAKNNLSNIEQDLQGVSLSGVSGSLASGMESGISMAQDAEDKVPGSTSSSIKGVIDIGDNLKDAADTEDVGQKVSNSRAAMRLDAMTVKLLDAVKIALGNGEAKAAVPDIDGLKANTENEVLSGKPVPAQKIAAARQNFETQAGGTAQKSDIVSDGSGNTCTDGLQKTENALDKGSISKTGIKGLTGNMELTNLKFSGRKDESITDSKDGPGQKDVNSSVKSDNPLFQSNEASKPIEASDGKAIQTEMGKQPVQVNKDDILNQVYDRIKVFKGDGSSELHVNLKPDQLGDVSIKLVMEKGTISARVTVENSEIKSIMQGSMPEIKEHLKEQNINVSNLSVYVGTDRSEADGGRDSQKYKWQQPKKLQPNSNVHASAVQETPYYGGVLNLLA